ncbi:MAG TPA: TadE family protein [Bryobacteraceae bacterium]|nr:TadE family protein [Bryobacteraceae bacterium]
MIEFTLVCIPLIFILISIVELARGMWIYNTVAFSVRKATRYAAVHGSSCAAASSACPITVDAVAQVIRGSATGIPPDQLSVVLQTTGTSLNCSPLNQCIGNASTWPPASDNSVGTAITISCSYPFRSALAMFWPGAGKVNFSTLNLGAKSQEEIVF